MKILVNLHKLEIGGSQLVAIRLAAALKGRGHESIIYGPPGPLAELAASRGLRVIPQTLPNGRRPSRRAALELRDLSREEHVDLVHASGHSVSIEAFFGAYVFGGIPLLCSIRGAEAVPRPYPKPIPLICAHQYIAEVARRSGFNHVYVMRPPVDTEADHPAVDPSAFLERHRLDDGCTNVVVVSRLGKKWKLEGLKRGIDAVALLAEKGSIRLVIVGDGVARDELSARADRANSRLGRRIVVLAGAMMDPRPAYAAADIVIGMQGSILRGMAFQKPAIVLGEEGFSEIVTPESIGPFLRKGFYGMGDGDVSPRRLADQLRTLVADGSLRDRLGHFSREVVCQFASLDSAADQLEGIYHSVVGPGPSLTARIAGGARLSADIVGARLRGFLWPEKTLKARRIAAWKEDERQTGSPHAAPLPHR
jgi:glycosyltransferase involved in cell wall biosynthesis